MSLSCHEKTKDSLLRVPLKASALSPAASHRSSDPIFPLHFLLQNPRCFRFFCNSFRSSSVSPPEEETSAISLTEASIFEHFCNFGFSKFGAERCNILFLGMGTNLIPDYGWIGEVAGSDGEFRWSLDGSNDLPGVCVQIDESYKDGCALEQTTSRKRSREDSLVEPKSKACREKLRRERLNDRFLELSSILEPGRPAKTDKAMILSDATRVLVQLRNEAQQLKEANEKLQETIKDLKAEKNELRDEKIKLKADKERLEQQVKAMSMSPAGFMPHIPTLQVAAASAFAAQGLAAGNKTATFPGFPGMAMWQWMPPAVVDTSQDHTLRPPVA